MSRTKLLFGLVLAAGSVSSMWAAPISLASVKFNVNGTVQTDYAGFDTSMWNQSTGVGILQYTFAAGPGTYDFGAFFDPEVSAPFYNEYGIANGAPAAGQTWEIGDSFTSNIYTDVGTGGLLSNANTLQGTASNYDGHCTAGATCNGDVALAMNFHFTLAANQNEVITFNGFMTDPGGFSLHAVHPVDPGNAVAGNYFLNGSAFAQDVVVGGVPEPGSFGLLLAAGLAWLTIRYAGSQRIGEKS